MKNLVEYYHIYQDANLNFFDCKSHYYLDKFENDDKVIMIDDFNISDKKWNLEDFDNHLNNKNLKYDYIFLESKFANYLEYLIELINDNLIYESFKKDNKIVFFFKDNNKKIPIYTIVDNEKIPTCVCLSTCFKLFKLNHEKFQSGFNYKKIISILPTDYKSVEENVLYLLKYINQEYSDKIEYIFF